MPEININSKTMAGENSKNNATQALKIEKLEMELKTAFKDGKFETVRKKAEDLQRLDPENRLAKRILEKVLAEEVEETERANASRIKVLEIKLDQAFKAGDLPGMNRLMEEIKKIDPKNRKVSGYQSTIEKAKSALESEMRKEKIQRLVAEVEFFVNKADWGGAESKANELLGLVWNHPVAMRAIGKVAKARRVRPESLITAKEPKIEAKPGFFARLFGKRSESAKPSTPALKEVPKIVSVPVAKPAVVEVAKPVVPAVAIKPAVPEVLKPVAKPVVLEAKKPEIVKPAVAKVEPKPEKPGLFASLFAKKPENAKSKEAPGATVLMPLVKSEVAKPAVPEVLKPVSVVAEVKPVAKPVVLEAKKPEVVKAALSKVEPKPEKPGLFASLFAKKPEIAKPKEASSATILKPVAKPASVEVAKPVVPAVAIKPAVAEVVKPVVKPVVIEAKRPEIVKPAVAKVEPKPAKPGFFARLFAKKPEVAKGAVPDMKPVQKPMVLEVKKAEPEKMIPKFNALASMLDTKPVVSASLKEASVPLVPMKTEVPVLKPVVPAVAVSVVSPKPVAGAKPVAPVVAPDAPKSSVFGSLFAKKEEPRAVVTAQAPVAKPAMPTVQPVKVVEAQAVVPATIVAAPVMPKPELKPIAAVAVAPKAPETQLKVEQKSVAKPNTNTLEKGNIFTNLFGKEEVEPSQKPSVSVLETIVAKTAPAKAEAKKEKSSEEGLGEGLLSFSSLFLKFSVVFMVVSATFLYVENMDTGNAILGVSFINKENNAIQLHNADASLATKQAELEKANKEIGKYKGGYQDESQKAIEKIVSNRMDWPAILGKLNEVTESVYAKNAISQYVQYNNYSYNTETGQITVSGTLSDPLGKNLTKLAELEQAFRNYPKDPSNPKDDRKPYFYGLAQFGSYAKSLNSATGRFQSSFNLSLSTKEAKKK